jgi:hypothetical protein
MRKTINTYDSIFKSCYAASHKYYCAHQHMGTASQTAADSTVSHKEGSGQHSTRPPFLPFSPWACRVSVRDYFSPGCFLLHLLNVKSSTSLWSLFFLLECPFQKDLLNFWEWLCSKYVLLFPQVSYQQEWYKDRQETFRIPPKNPAFRLEDMWFKQILLWCYRNSSFLC